MSNPAYTPHGHPYYPYYNHQQAPHQEAYRQPLSQPHPASHQPGGPPPPGPLPGSYNNPYTQAAPVGSLPQSYSGQYGHDQYAATYHAAPFRPSAGGYSVDYASDPYHRGHQGSVTSPHTQYTASPTAPHQQQSQHVQQYLHDPAHTSRYSQPPHTHPSSPSVPVGTAAGSHQAPSLTPATSLGPPGQAFVTASPVQPAQGGIDPSIFLRQPHPSPLQAPAASPGHTDVCAPPFPSQSTSIPPSGSTAAPAPPVSATATASAPVIPKVKLRISRPALDQHQSNDMRSTRNHGASAHGHGGGGGYGDVPRRGSAAGAIIVKDEPMYTSTGRPQRNASSRAQQQMQAQAVQEEYEELHPDDYSPASAVARGGSGRRSSRGAGGGGGGGEDAHAEDDDAGRRRSGRERKAPVKYAGSDEFDDRGMEASPAAPARRDTRRRKIVDPDSEGDEADDADGDEEYDAGAYKPASTQSRRAFPARTTRASLHSTAGSSYPPHSEMNGTGSANGLSADVTSSAELGDSLGTGTSNGIGLSTRRTTRRGHATPAKSRHSSADDESFHGSAHSPSEDEDDASDDPIARDMDDETEETDLDSTSSQDHDRDHRRRSSRRKPHRTAAVPMKQSISRTRSGGVQVRRSTRNSARARHEAHLDDEDEDEFGGPKRALRTRKTVNYELPPADISIELRQAELMESIQAASRPNGAARAAGGRAGRGTAGGARFGAGPAGKGLGWGLGGRDLARAMGDPDTSDSDDLLSPMKAVQPAQPGLNTGPMGGSKVTAPTDVVNFGRVNPKSSMADADPLGVDTNVSFDNVGGLDGHIDQLKEMVALPLLYPEVFQKFGIIPPRGVLFHGPPGTGKTLLARALAASCSNGNTKIAFFMRKGADVLSKWVGEAERQLRMLFEEARAAQPSIIFFDEIDGLAPVRSSKQDQIHASLVSTLLALMDGMDGRGQVIVIGATNRPDSVDPALRRPGRFDREFYFPLPNKTAREKIIRINTRVWNPPLEEGLVQMLGGLTKGYGGADLRALCTEAALNAIQRRYPQIYRSTDRYELDTGSIHVKAKDFLMAVKKIVPSSARSTASTAIPLPSHLIPLLASPLERLKAAVDAVLPRHKYKTALEEAMFEEDEGDVGNADLLQSLDKMRTYRPRVLVTGQAGMGQGYLGPAILHHLEGFHVQNLDLGVLLGDSTRTVEATLIQLFVEAKRHQPSIIYIPAINVWANTLSDSAKATFRSLLDGILPSEPVLLLGIAEEEGEEVAGDVRSWFGWGLETEVELVLPTQSERTTYFAPLIEHVRSLPTSWPDAIPRRPRVPEQLKLAAPLPPRQPTEAELHRERERDLNARNMMVLSFTGLLQELGRKYKRIVSSVRDDAFLVHQLLTQEAVDAAAAVASTEMVEEAGNAVDSGSGATNAATHPTDGVHVHGTAGYNLETDSTTAPVPNQAPAPSLATANGHPSHNAGTADAHGVAEPATTTMAAGISGAGATAPALDWLPHDLDIDILTRKLTRHKYFTPRDFLDDIDRIKANAERVNDIDRQNKVAEMSSHAYLHVAEFDPRWGPEFEAYKERMGRRKAERAEKRAKASEPEVAGGVGSAQGQEEVRAEGNAQAAPAPASQLGQKRPRDDGEDLEMDGAADAVGDAQPGKRMKEDGHPFTVAVNGNGYTAPSPFDSNLPTTPSAPSSASILLHARAAPGVLPSSPGLASATTSTSTALASVPAPRQPTPTYPPFVVPEEDLEDLRQSLITDTARLTVEDLERLRAGLFDKIWRMRGEWDRTEMVKQLADVLRKVLRSVVQGRTRN